MNNNSIKINNDPSIFQTTEPRMVATKLQIVTVTIIFFGALSVAIGYAEMSSQRVLVAAQEAMPQTSTGVIKTTANQNNR